MKQLKTTNYKMHARSALRVHQPSTINHQPFLRLLSAGILLGCLLAISVNGADTAESADSVAEPTNAVTPETTAQPGGQVIQAEDPAPATPTQPEAATATEAPAPKEPADDSRRVRRDALVMIGKDAVLKANETANAVVAVGGSVKVLGRSEEAAVAVAGDIEVQGEVGDAVVAVLGNVKIGPNARVGEVISVGGKVEIAEGAVVEGGTQEIDFGMLGLATPEWLKDWFRECVLKLRLLAPGVPWVWAVFGAFLLLYTLVAVLFPRPVAACVDDLMERPATTFLVGLLLMVLLPLVFIILVATGIGAFVVPFLFAAVVFGGIIGKVALIEGLGLAIARPFGKNLTDKPLVSLLAGSLIIALLYIIPVLGLIAFSVMALWSLGCATTAAIGGLRRELPSGPSPAMPQPGYVSPIASEPHGMGNLDPAPGESFGGGTATGAATATMAVPPLIAVAEVLTHPKASFWERMGAGFLDMVLLGIVLNILNLGAWGFIVALAYFGGLWTWRGTTIGGIVLGLKVIRTNGEPVSFVAALVRGLAATFSIVVLFLGFIWIAWDKEKQGWHDQIAGTYVLKLPRGTPLVCF